MKDKLKALADPTRLDIVKLLLKKPRCVGCLAKKLGISAPAVSQHIKVLKNAGLVLGEKKGYFVHYSVKRETLCQLSQDIGRLALTEAKENHCCHSGDKKCGCHREE